MCVLWMVEVGLVIDPGCRATVEEEEEMFNSLLIALLRS